MSMIERACAYANNAVSYLAWSVPPDKLAGCLGFEITRVYKADGTKRCLAAWVPFAGQTNPEWKPQDTSVWPIQKFTWRDLTVRQRRDVAELRQPDQVIFYQVRPVCDRRPGLAPVESKLPVTYQGAPRLLSYMDEGSTTNEVTPTTDFAPMTVAFNSGILSTQWLVHALERAGMKPTPGAVSKEIEDVGGKIRAYLAGDLPSLFQEMFRDLGSDELYLSLYELSDPQLLQLLIDNAPRVHLILSNSSANTDGVWDAENQPARDRLHKLKPALAEMHDRLFNNKDHIGHNKFVVRVDGRGNALKVLSGSTNWTPSGLCAQSNNAYIADVPELAHQFLGYWNSLKQDTASFEAPASTGATTRNVQGPELRSEDAQPLSPLLVDDWGVRLWRSPNTKQATKRGSDPALPPDMAEVFGYMRQARQAIFFAVFLPSQQGATSIIAEAIDIARKDGSLMVYGAISDPLAMPNYVPPKAREDAADKFEPAIFEEGKVHLVRATALPGDLVGNFEREILKPQGGHAIIHDKLLVIDPLGPEPVVVVGSHNLGYKASYSNDDNLVIIRRNARLAQAYMVHVLDLYEHYRFRSVQAERQHEGKPAWSGFLQTSDTWAAKYEGGASDLSRYLCSASVAR